MIRVRYIGTNLNAGGIMYGLQEPTHGDVANASTAVMMSRTSCQHRPVTSKRDWFEVRYRPVDNHDVSWIDGVTYTSATNYILTSDGSPLAWSQYPFMGIHVNAAAATQPFEYEFWAVIEFAGANVTGKTLTPPDLQGWASVIAAHSQFEERYVGETRPSDTGATGFLSSTIRSYADAMLNAAAPYVTSFAQAAGAAAVNHFTQQRGRLPNRRQALLQ